MYHYAVYAWHHDAPNGEQNTDYYIVLKDVHGVVERFTGLEIYAYPYTGQRRLIRESKREPLVQICLALNNILHQHLGIPIAAITAEMVTDEFRAYRERTRQSNDEAYISQQSLSKHTEAVCSFFSNIALRHNTALSPEELMHTVFLKKTKESSKVIQRYMPRFALKAIHSPSTDIFRDFHTEAASLLIEEVEKHDRMAASGELSDNDCINTADGYIAHMMAKWHRPNKTSAFASVPPLNFFCPESCKPILGKILLIAGAHYMLSGMEGLFVNKITAGNYIIPFFGQEFWAACGRRRFSGRRANKALMQAVETQAEETVNPVAAYAIASIMRSHKGGYAKLSQTTDLYLRDSKFQGYTPELIAYLMAERGPCSFVVDYLLGKCYRDSYASLPPVEQTIALKQLGMAPLQIDNVLRMIQLARTQAKIIVAEITPDTKTAKGALIMLCAGHAPGKEMGDLCFRRAAKLSCACPDRDNCTGCLYEIRTKATLLRYLTAYKYLLKLDNLTVNEKNKNTYLRKKIIEPILYEYAIHLQTNGLLENDMISKAILLEGTSNGCT